MARRPLVAEAVPPFESTIVRLDPAEVARMAEAARAELAVKLADGVEMSLWAPEELLADPIGLSVDSLGRVYVTRTRRTDQAELDIRGHPDWMVESITFDHVEDKRQFYFRELDPSRSAQNDWLPDYNEDGSRDWRDLTVHEESVYRIEDTNGTGRADFSQVIIEGFDDVVSDVAHGVLAHNDEVYLTLSPDIWRMRDTDGDGAMDVRESLAHGSGVHIGFGGHGLSGPIIGPDGRLYWSMGDLGVNIVNREGERISRPNEGLILRAEPDGSNLEIFAGGLRNPHEFGWDAHGNLITADNDGDHPGEHERIVYITEGSDAGWRINWQFGKYVDPRNNDYKVWMDEGLYKPRFPGQAAYITPPVAAYHRGPSGVVYNPGTALSDEWKGYFFVSAFGGSPSNSSVNAFRLEEKGAGFELADDRVVADGVLITGIEFGPDGALYIADWIEGWSPNNRGRVWKLDTPSAASSELRRETRALIEAPMASKTTPEMVELLSYPDMRVRLKAQFALVDQGETRALVRVARNPGDRLARLHAIWGIGQVAREDLRQAAVLRPLLREQDVEVRAQAAKVLGDVRYGRAAGDLVPLLRDAAPRVRFFAAEALGRLDHEPAIQPIIQMLAENDDRDVYLRHAGSLALARIGEAEPIVALAEHPSRGARIAAVVALRRMRHPGIARFLQDRDEYVVTEAARAINDDESIPEALPALAAVLDDPRFTAEPLLRRAVNANLRVGTAESARRLVEFARRGTGPDTMRAEAIATLGVWPEPSILDRVDGFHRGEMDHDPRLAPDPLQAMMGTLFEDGPPIVQIALAEAAANLRLAGAGELLLGKVRSGDTPEVRIAALRALRSMEDPRAEEAVRISLGDPVPPVRMAALEILPELGLPEAASGELLSQVIKAGTVAEQQTALGALADLGGTTAREVFTQLVNALIEGEVDPAIRLDVAEAARRTEDPTLAALVEQYESGFADADPMIAYADALVGGSAEAGRRIFFRHPAAQCARCHGIGSTAENVGPDLAGVGARLTREQLLEALVAPSARIAPGFGLPGGYSAMPPMGGILNRREIRDVVEYLTTLDGSEDR